MSMSQSQSQVHVQLQLQLVRLAAATATAAAAAMHIIFGIATIRSEAVMLLLEINARAVLSFTITQLRPRAVVAIVEPTVGALSNRHSNLWRPAAWSMRSVINRHISTATSMFVANEQARARSTYSKGASCARE